MKSEVEVMLSQISYNISEVYVKMSDLNSETKSRCLSAVSKILHELGCLVATKLSDNNISHDHNSNIYKLYYDDEEEIVHSNSSDEEVSVHSNSSDEEESVHTNSSDEEGSVHTNSSCEDVFIARMVSFIRSSTPSQIYDASRMKAKRRRKMKRRVHSELRSIWVNATSIFSPIPVNAKQSTNLYPRVDWKFVNKRFLSNIPLPSSLPLHGCSPNPDDYKDEFRQSDYGGMQNLGSKFDREFPLGTSLGFLTDAGPINLPDEIFHGYSYQPGHGWVLHAKYPEKVKKRKKRVQRG